MHSFELHRISDPFLAGPFSIKWRPGKSSAPSCRYPRYHHYGADRHQSPAAFILASCMAPFNLICYLPVLRSFAAQLPEANLW